MNFGVKMPLNIKIMAEFVVLGIREAFQSKKQRNLGISPNRGEGGRQKIKKVPSFSWE